MERINAQDTSKDKAGQLILMIQKKCISGARPYSSFLTALDECDQAHLSKIVTAQSVKDKDYEAFNGEFNFEGILKYGLLEKLRGFNKH